MKINNVFLGNSTCFSFEESTLTQTLPTSQSFDGTSPRMPLQECLSEIKSVFLRNLLALPAKNLKKEHSALHRTTIEILPENNVQGTSERH